MHLQIHAPPSFGAQVCTLHFSHDHPRNPHMQHYQTTRLLRKDEQDRVDVVAVTKERIAAQQNRFLYYVYDAQSQWAARPIPLDGTYHFKLRALAESQPQVQDYIVEANANEGTLTMR